VHDQSSLRPSGRNTTRYSSLPSTRALIASRVCTRSATAPFSKYAAPRANERSPANFASEASVISFAKGSLNFSSPQPVVAVTRSPGHGVATVPGQSALRLLGKTRGPDT
jgi:hypothetical protein